MKIAKNNTVCILFCNKEYYIEKEKIIYILNRLNLITNKSELTDEKIPELLKKYDLYDEGFLENINKIW